MRIAYITAGAAGMYCGSCLHDNTLAAALLKLGEDVLLVAGVLWLVTPSAVWPVCGSPAWEFAVFR